MSRDVQIRRTSRSSRCRMDKGGKGCATETQRAGEVHGKVPWHQGDKIVDSDAGVKHSQVVRSELNPTVACSPPSPLNMGEKSPEISQKDISPRRAHRNVSGIATAAQSLG